MINAAEGGGYFSAGGVRRFVSERPGEAGFARLGNQAFHAVPSAERLTVTLDQLSKLEHSLLLLSGDARDVIRGVRGLGKYGDRLIEVIREAGLYKHGEWRGILARCQRMKSAADSGSVAGRLAMSSAEARQVVREAETLFNDMIFMSDNLMWYVQSAANLPAISRNMARDLQYVTLAHVKLLRSVDWTLGHLRLIAQTIARAEARRPADSGNSGEDNDSVPE
jgi:hypothetical protein